MRATVMYGPGDVRVENRPEPTIKQPTDAIVRVVRACICGSDLHPYHSMTPTRRARPWVTSSSVWSKRSALRCRR